MAKKKPIAVMPWKRCDDCKEPKPVLATTERLGHMLLCLDCGGKRVARGKMA